jgi:3-hydroxyacyl-[acyl-carrier-protein] dehydratase
MKQKTLFGMEDILSILPHRPPFLFVDRVTKLVPDKEITAERTLRDDEPFFAGHFPQKPIMPGVLVTDALAQASGLLLGLSLKAAGTAIAKEPKLFFLASVNIKYISPSFPGETLDLHSRFEKKFGVLFSFSVEAFAGRKTVAKGVMALAMIDGKP